VDSMGFFRGNDGSVRSVTEELARWEEEQKAASAISQKKEQANTRNIRNDRRLNDAADAQAVSKEEEHSAEVQVQYLCPHTTLYVSSYYCICVLIPLYMCPHTTMCVKDTEST
jgi:hypothetical protein